VQLGWLHLSAYNPAYNNFHKAFAMAEMRPQFTSTFGFVMAATGSAVGLGNIWGFPTQAASNGGGAFLVAYLILAFVLAYPALMAELMIGRHGKANIVTSLHSLGTRPATRKIGSLVGYVGVITASLILSFYAIVAGWMLSRFFQAGAQLIGWSNAELWLAQTSSLRDLLVCAIFSLLTIYIVARGVSDGIERWSTRLMPMLVIILLGLIIYVVTLPGAMTGLRHYLLPDISRLSDPGLLLSAMSQAFFSLSLGVGVMLVYGSYLNRQPLAKGDSLPRLGASVALLDVSLAFTAGLLIIPTMYVAQEQGITIFTDRGELVAGPGLVLQVLPALFDNMGIAGVLVSLAFFALMVIAALTSSISMLEVPVSVTVEKSRMSRKASATIIGSLIFIISVALIMNMELLFDGLVVLTTSYSQPLLGLALCLFAGWILFRNNVLQKMRAEDPAISRSIFWRVWPVYVRFVCPLFIVLMLIQSLR
jgi:NSS family neurotransmitter:Na+ symporter